MTRDKPAIDPKTPNGTPNGLVVVTTTHMSNGPDAIARLADGRVAFVYGAGPDEKVEARIVSDHGSYVRAHVTTILEPGPDRREPPCRHAREGICGGCPWQHVTDTRQHAEKEALIRREATRHLPGVTVHPILTPLPAFGYRRRARFGHRDGRVGYRTRGTHSLFAIDQCPILHPDLEAALPAVRHAVRNRASGNVDAMLFPDGRVRIGEEAAPFAQPSADAEAALVELVLAALPERPARIVELFAGAGTFTVPMLSRGHRVDAYEGDRATVARLRDTAPNARAFQVNLLKADRTPTDQLHFGDADCVVLDPPRAGALPCIDAIARTGAKTVIYVSCDPMTLFRDLKALTTAGYDVESVQPVDAFPQTPHIETVAVCRRRGVTSFV